MFLILANMCSRLQVYSPLVHLMLYQISKVCLALMYIQQKHMVYGEFHRHYYLVLDQISSDNAYSALLLHEVWNVDHKMVIQGITLCYNILSHLGVQQQHYHEHDTVCLSILFSWFFLCFPWSMNPLFRCSFVRCCWNYLAKLTSYFCLPVCICIW